MDCIERVFGCGQDHAAVNESPNLVAQVVASHSPWNGFGRQTDPFGRVEVPES
jgi:hypothetical protein